MDKITLPSGRVIHVEEVYVTKTYAGFLEGTRTISSQYVRSSLIKKVSVLTQSSGPFQVLDEGMEELPEWLYVVKFNSYDRVKDGDEDDGSYLFVCWFSSNLDFMESFLCSHIANLVNWDDLAENTCFF